MTLEPWAAVSLRPGASARELGRDMVADLESGALSPSPAPALMGPRGGPGWGGGRSSLNKH